MSCVEACVPSDSDITTEIVESLVVAEVFEEGVKIDPDDIKIDLEQE